MTITYIRPGLWELRTRHGQLVDRGELHRMVTLWARMVRAGWSDTPYGQPAIHPLTGARTTECTIRHDCECRACTDLPILRAVEPPAPGPSATGSTKPLLRLVRRR
jgi:hypothetical protein